MNKRNTHSHIIKKIIAEFKKDISLFLLLKLKNWYKKNLNETNKVFRNFF